jgi:hypothetical protein
MHTALIFLSIYFIAPSASAQTADTGQQLANQCRDAYKNARYAEAFELCSRAYRMGNKEASVGLARMYNTGQGSPKDLAKAAELWAVTAHISAISAYNLASLYASGSGVAQSWEQARLLYVEACHKGHPKSCADAGYIYELGHGVPNNRQTAISYFNQAGSLGDDKSGQIARLLRDPSTPQFHSAEEIGDSVGRAIAPALQTDSLAPGTAAGQGKNEDLPRYAAPSGNLAGASADQLWKAAREKYLNMDHRGAAILARQAAVAGSLIATYEIGYFYDNGDGVAQNKAAAAEWFGRCAAKNYPQCDQALGNFYELGEGGLAQNWITAAQHYAKAAAQRFGQAEFSLGRCYEYGIGVPVDLKQAVAWYQRATEHGEGDGKTQAKYLLDNHLQSDLTLANNSERSLFPKVELRPVASGRLFRNEAERMQYLREVAQYNSQIDVQEKRNVWNMKNHDYQECKQEGGANCSSPGPVPH